MEIKSFNSILFKENRSTLLGKLAKSKINIILSSIFQKYYYIWNVEVNLKKFT